MKKFSLLLGMLFFVMGVSFAQRTITGTVSDDKGETLIGASVLEKGTLNGTVTDVDGKFSLSVAKEGSVLTISYTGFTSKEISLGASNVVDVKLEQGVLLTETVVTALGISKSDKSLGYASQQVNGNDVVRANTLSVLDGLSGQISGAQISSSSGAVGGSTRIVLRGQTTLDGDNQALIVVDGLRVDNSAFQTEGTTGGVAQSNRGIDINPNDVESISVLKGAAASALYGVDGAKGVIVITTKKGSSKKGKGISIEFSTGVTMSRISQTQALNQVYAKGTGNALRAYNTATSTSWGPRLDTLGYDGVTNEYDPNGNLVGKSNPNYKTPANVYDPYAIFQTGVSTQNNLALSSNLGDNSSLRFSFGNNNENGVLPLNNLNRSTAGVSTRSNFFDNKLRINTSFNYVYSKSRRIQQGSNTNGLMLGLLRTPPSFNNSYGLADPLNDDDGTGRNRAIYQSNGRERNYRNGSGYDNPYWSILNNPYNDQVSRFYGNIDVTYEFTKLFQVNAKLGTDAYSDTRVQSFELASVGSKVAGQILDDKYNVRIQDFYLNILGNTNITNDLTFSYVLGANHYDKVVVNKTIQGDGFAFAGFPSLNNVATVQAFAFNDTRRNFALYGTADIGYKNFLYLGVTGRNDWVSTLIAPTQGFDGSKINFFYPSVNASFVFSELLPKSNVFNLGKIRISYGTVGGGATQPYQTYTPYVKPNPADGYTNGISFPFNGAVGYRLSYTKGNDLNLKPSSTSDFEIGTDLKLVDNRISISGSFYTRKTKDAILSVPIPSSTGYNSAILNAGQLSTTGVDFTLGIIPIRTRDFTWDVKINFTKWTTIVDKLADGVENQFLGGFSNPGIFNFVGQQYGQIFGGAYSRANNADGTKFDAALPYNPKGVIIIGADGYPNIDNTNRVIGNPNPDFLLSINNNFSYKGFRISALIDIKQGGQIWNGTLGALNNFGASKITADQRGTSLVFPGITESGVANTKSVILDQAYFQSKGTSFGSQVESFVEDASFARLRTVSIGYTLPNSLLKTIRMEDLTLTFTGRNLWLKTNNTGVDPETSLTGNGNAQGLEYFNMPGTKSWAFGLSVKF